MCSNVDDDSTCEVKNHLMMMMMIAVLPNENRIDKVKNTSKGAAEISFHSFEFIRNTHTTSIAMTNTIRMKYRTTRIRVCMK